MFESFNFFQFFCLLSVYAVLLTISQVYMRPIATWFAKMAVTNFRLSFIAGVAGLVVWIAALIIFGWEAAAVAAIGAVVEPTITYIRRKTILAAVMKNFEDPALPLNFNEINGKTL